MSLWLGARSLYPNTMNFAWKGPTPSNEKLELIRMSDLAAYASYHAYQCQSCVRVRNSQHDLLDYAGGLSRANGKLGSLHPLTGAKNCLQL